MSKTQLGLCCDSGDPGPACSPGTRLVLVETRACEGGCGSARGMVGLLHQLSLWQLLLSAQINVALGFLGLIRKMMGSRGWRLPGGGAQGGGFGEDESRAGLNPSRDQAELAEPPFLAPPPFRATSGLLE